MSLIEGAIHINRPVDEVFDFVADERNEPRYNRHMRSAVMVSAGPIAEGTRFRVEIVSWGRAHPMDVVFTRFERPRLLASSTHMAAMDVEGGLTFEPVAGGTRLSWAWETRLHGLFRLVTFSWRQPSAGVRSAPSGQA